MAQTANVVQLKPRTLQAFDDYIREAEAAMEPSLHGRGSFLWSDSHADSAHQLRQGHIVAQLWTGDGPVKVTNGLIHDWIGAALVPKNIYKPEVVDSRLISHEGNHFQIFLRLLKTKIISVVLDTDHDVHYSSLDAARWSCRSRTTRIAEVEEAGTPKERVLEPDTGYGFLWRLYSYWRFEEKRGGCSIECRAISLTRDIPLGLGWIIEPIIRNLPQESLIHTLDSTRRALLSADQEV